MARRALRRRYHEDDPTVARPINEYSKDMGDVLWWKFPIIEPPYVGSPDDPHSDVEVLGTPEEIADFTGSSGQTKVRLGGWPGYHTHFTRIVIPSDPSMIHDD